MATTAPANDAISAPQSIRGVIRQAGAVRQMCITFRTASLWSQQRLRERQGSFISSVMQKCHFFGSNRTGLWPGARRGSRGDAERDRGAAAVPTQSQIFICNCSGLTC